VIEQIIGMDPANRQVFFYRTTAGAEIGLLLLDGTGKPVAIEVKYSLTPKPPRGFLGACTDLACERAYLVYPGREVYPLGRSITALPVGNLSALL